MSFREVVPGDCGEVLWAVRLGLLELGFVGKFTYGSIRRNNRGGIVNNVVTLQFWQADVRVGVRSHNVTMLVVGESVVRVTDRWLVFDDDFRVQYTDFDLCDPELFEKLGAELLRRGAQRCWRWRFKRWLVGLLWGRSDGGA